MLESEAKKKRCPHMMVSASINLMSALRMVGSDAAAADIIMSKTEESGSFNCQGSNCMMWECELKEEIHVDEKPSLVGEYAPELVPPEGDGWKEKGRRVHSTARSADPFAGANQSATITWHRWVPADRGDCGLKTKELYCNASC